MKVYVVTQGSYSDYHIEQVFLEREKAELYCKIHNTSTWNPLFVEEFDTYDEHMDSEVKGLEYAYYFTVNKDGSTGYFSCEKLSEGDRIRIRCDEWELPGKLKFEYQWNWPKNDNLIGLRAVIITKEINHEKARKIVEDYLAEYNYLCVESGDVPPWTALVPMKYDAPFVCSAPATVSSLDDSCLDLSRSWTDEEIDNIKNGLGLSPL